MNPLERRYRRLLRAYPAEHRAAHGEEMLGVLLDAAGPDRTRPVLADTADVLRGALLVRARRAGTAGRADAMSVASLLATALMCAGVPAGLGVAVLWHSAFSLLLLAWPAVLLAGLLGLRRTAAWTGGAAAAAMAASSVPSNGDLPGVGWGWAWLGAAACAATAISGGPRQGAAVLGRVRTGVLLAGVVPLGTFVVFAPSYGHALLPRLPLPLSGPEQAWTALAVAVAVLGWAVGTNAAARRAAMLLAAPLAVLAVTVLRSAYPVAPDGLARTLIVHELAVAAIAAAAAAVLAIASARIARVRQH